MMREAYAIAVGAQRLDKWLWAARFFKTRSLAAVAIAGGKVQVANQRVKPARLVRSGDRISIRKGELLWEVTVQGLSKDRRPASEAVLLYEETPESKAYRAQQAQQRRQLAVQRTPGTGRPTKRDRRKLTELQGR
ncbi:MAG: S4 domain-containing protein [Gammaproteobacteria bacterium]